MDVRAAKDFLVEQTTQQASLERAPLSDLEKRMMYFTESSDAAEDPVKLNEEFESQRNSDEYEKKVSLLLADAYKRIKNGDAQAVAEWDAAIDTLREGDHYFACSLRPGHDKPNPSRKHSQTFCPARGTRFGPAGSFTGTEVSLETS